MFVTESGQIPGNNVAPQHPAPSLSPWTSEQPCQLCFLMLSLCCSGKLRSDLVSATQWLYALAELEGDHGIFDLYFFSVSSFSDSSNLWKSARLPWTRKDWQNLIGLCTDVSTAHIYIVLFTCTHTRNLSSLCSATSCSQTHTKDCCKHKSCQLIWFFSVKNGNICTSWIKGVEAKLAENTSDTHTHTQVWQRGN